MMGWPRLGSPGSVQGQVVVCEHGNEMSGCIKFKKKGVKLMFYLKIRLIHSYMLIPLYTHCYIVGKPEEKRPLGRPRRRWEDNIKMYLREVGRGGD